MTPSLAELRRARPRRRRVRRGERGVALIMVISALAILYVLAQQTRQDVELHSAAAAVARDQVIAEYQAKSVINLARLLLHAEPTIRRALTPVLGPMMAIMGRGLQVPQVPIWEQADLLLGAFRSREGGQSFARAAGVSFERARGLGALTGVSPVVIVDEDSKINVNGFDRGPHIARRVAQSLLGLFSNPRLDPYFTTRDPDGQFSDRVTVVGAIVDYADSDINAFDVQALLSTAVGATAMAPEDSFYSFLRPAYIRRNAPYDSVQELRLVRGLGDDDLWQTAVDPDPSNPRRRTLTVWGQGAVNVNTANAQTVLALICAFAPTSPQCTDPSAASAFITGLTLIQSFTTSMGIPVFTTPRDFVQTVQGRPPFGPMLAALGIQPFQITGNQLEQAVTTESKVFSIFAEANVGHAHVRIHAVVDMRPQPGIPSAFLNASTGALVRPQPAGTTVVTTSTGSAAIVTPGGTLLYWREE